MTSVEAAQVSQLFSQLGVLKQQQQTTPDQFGFSEIFSRQPKFAFPKVTITMDHSKIRFSKESFSWYRNRNIPKISLLSSSLQQSDPNASSDFPNTCSPPNSNSQINTHSNQALKYYITSCFEDSQSGFQLTPLDGECTKRSQSNQLCTFSSLKFQKTTYILNVKGFHIFNQRFQFFFFTPQHKKLHIVAVAFLSNQLISCFVSSPITVLSWKNYLHDRVKLQQNFSYTSKFLLLKF